MNIYESLENLQVSEECFNDIMGTVEEILNENVVDDYYSKKLKDVKNNLAIAKSHKRHLNKTVDKQPNKEYKQAAGQQRQANDDKQQMEQEYYKSPYRTEYDIDNDPSYQQVCKDLNSASNKKYDASKKFSKKGSNLSHEIINLKNKRDDLENKIKNHKRNGQKTTFKPEVPVEA